MDNIKEKIKTLSDETIVNMLNQRKDNDSSFKKLLIAEQEKRKIANDSRHHPIMATNWETYLMEVIKTGLTSPTPYKVIPYKNGVGIKKIELL